MSKRTLYIRHKALPGKRDEVRRIWDKYARAYAESNDGQLAGFYCYDDNDPDTIVVFSVHSDQENLADFSKQPWFAAYQAETMALVAGPSEARWATPQWTKGVS